MSFTFRFLNHLSLSSRLKLLTVLWVGSALLSVILTLVLSWRLQNAATVIEDAGNLRTQVYRLAYMVGEHAPRAQINNQIREFEQNLNRISQSNAIHPLMPSETPPAYDLIQSALIEDWKYSPSCAVTSVPTKSSSTVLQPISNCFYRRWNMPMKKTPYGCAAFK